MGPLSLLPILGLAMFLARALNVGPGAGCVHAVATIMLALFAAALLDGLWWVTLGIHVAGVLLLAYETRRVVLRGPPYSLPVPVGLLIVAVAMFWQTYGADQFFFYDEYSHWGIYVKEMLALDGFWPGNTNALHARYLPGPSLFQYFFNALSTPAEGKAYLGQFVLLVVPLLVLFDGLRYRQLGWIFGLLALCLLVLTNFGPGIHSLYVDHVLGTWFVGVVLCVVLDRERPAGRLYVYALPVAALALIKDAGLAFAVAASAIIVAAAMRRDAAGSGSTLAAAWKAARMFVLLIAPPMICVQLWNWNRDGVDAPHDVMSSLGISEGLVELVTGTNPGQHAVTTRHFLDVFVHTQLSNNDWFWQFNEFTYDVQHHFSGQHRLTTAALLCAFGAWWLLLQFRQPPGGPRRVWGVVAGGLFLTAAGYVISLYLAYLFAFAERGVMLPSYTRYLSTITLPLLICCFAPLLPGFRTPLKTESRSVLGAKVNVKAGVFGLGLAILYLFETPYFQPVLLPNPSIEPRRQWEPLTRTVQATISRASLWIYLPDDDPHGFVARLLRYLLAPNTTSVEGSRAGVLQDPAATLETWKQFDYLWFPLPLAAETQQLLSELTGGRPVGPLLRVRVSPSGELALESVVVEASR